ncbi:MAG: fluoride efflux transporter CrcB [Actinobacteria bacterium]|nr:fluoride efflux transporter CrcB [Actinomycetota bacterium]MCI0544858.1 fluoride efflux transporter CrcB [Actinomycetota bacterium]MCI0678990.1 fluoride efflux transporter CrcB [Actinomycetota bacterium]
MSILGLLVGGALGALVRYQVEGLIAPRQQTPFPLSTLVVNVTGSLLLGLVVGLGATSGLPDTWLLWIGTGFLGAFTTFSTFTYETVNLIEGRAWRYAGSNLALSGPLSFAAAAAGYLIGS